MSGPQSVNITNTNSLFDAFKKLTVGREQNRGTLMVSRDANGQVELKCVNHKFMGGKVNVKTNQAMLVRSTLRNAVQDVLARSENSKIAADYDHRDAISSKYAALMDLLDRNMGISGNKVLGRADIGKIITNVENFVAELRVMDVDKFLDADVDTLCDLAVGKITYDEIAGVKNAKRTTGAADAKQVLDDFAAHVFADAKGDTVRDGFAVAFGDTMVNYNPNDEELKALSESMKKSMSEGTDRMRGKLQKLADLYMKSGPEKDEVLNLIVKDEKKIAARGGVDVLSCADIAKAIKTIANSAKTMGYDILSENTDEEKLAVAGNALKLDMKKALGKALLAENGKPEVLAKACEFGRRKVEGMNFVKMMADDTLRKEAAERARKRLKEGEPAFVTCKEMEVGEGKPAKNISEQYSIFFGDSSDAAKACEAKGKKPAVQIFADGHYCACGLPNGWGTQEETVVAKDPELQDAIALLYEEGKIEATLDKAGRLRFEYKDLSTTGGGYVINTGTRLYAFFSMPSFSGEETGIDVRGDFDWFCEDKKLSGHELSAEEKDNAYKFIDTFTSLMINGELGCKEEEFEDVARYLMFGRDPEFDITKPISDDQLEETVKKFAQSISKFDKGKIEGVKNNYVNTVGNAFALMTKVLVALGAKAIVTGKGGVGTFKNPLGWAAEATKQMTTTSGDADIVHADFDGREKKQISEDALVYQNLMIGDAEKK